jgi:hypothetical protein
MTYSSFDLSDEAKAAGVGFIKTPIIKKEFPCIGQKERGKRCQNVLTIERLANAPDADNIAPNPEHPTWPYLCPTCANQPARKGSTNSNGIVQERPKK